MGKKLLLIAIVAVGGWYVYKRLQSGRNEQNLWAEATDPVNPSGGH